jgi:hypothetical protein
MKFSMQYIDRKIFTALKCRCGAKLLWQVATTEGHDGVFLGRTLIDNNRARIRKIGAVKSATRRNLQQADSPRSNIELCSLLFETRKSSGTRQLPTPST